MELSGRPLVSETGNTDYISDSEVAGDPLLESEDISEQTDEVQLDSAAAEEQSIEGEKTEEKRHDFRLPFIVGIAFVALSAVYVTVRRLLTANTLSDGRHEAHPKKALVTKTLRPPAHKTRSPGLSPDNNLTFVVSEDFKLTFDEASKLRDNWQRSLFFVPNTSSLIDQLLRNGANCIGKAYTETSPLTIVETGNEVFRNPEKSGTITGGEYSGCGVLVRSGMVDFAVAMDTVGGVRITAACCGVIGFKPTYGCIPLGGTCIKSSALDTASFIIKESKYLSRLGHMLDLPGSGSTKGIIVKIYLAKDLFDHWMETDGKEMVYALAKAAITWAGPEQVEEVDLGEFLLSHATGWKDFASEEEEDNVYEALRQVQNTIAMYELKCKLLKDCNFTPEEPAEEVEKYHRALKVRQCIQEAFKQGIRDNKIVMIPGLMSPPPSREAPAAQLNDFEIETQRLCALSTLVGCPQIYFPIHNKFGDTYSVSMISLNKSDKKLMAVSESLIPLTKQMLDTELLNERHVRRRKAPSEDNQRLSDKEFESERWREIGNSCYKDCKYDEAVVAYSEAINRCPHKAVYYSNRAMAHIKLGHYIFAEDDCTKAIGLESNNAKALLRRGVARKTLGKLIEAQEDIIEVLNIEPNNRQARIELADLEHFLCRE
eukprot:g3291.t1